MNPTVSELAPSLRDRLRVFIEHPRCDRTIVARFSDLLHIFGHTVLGVFYVELLLLLFVYRSHFFHDRWCANDNIN